MRPEQEHIQTSAGWALHDQFEGKETVVFFQCWPLIRLGNITGTVPIETMQRIESRS
jgi:hypothetical protein